MGRLPACLNGHMATLGQRLDLVLILNACVLNHRKSPKKDFSQGAWDRKAEPCLLTCSFSLCTFPILIS